MRSLTLTAALTALGVTLALPASAELRVVATLPDLAAIAAAVGGPDAAVQVLASSDEDPHYVDPKPSLVLPLSRADLLVVNGLELEIGWLPPLLVNARNAAIQPGAAGHFDASAHVKKLGVTGGQVDRAHGDVHPMGSPHYTVDPRAGRAIALALAERMAKLAPEAADGFRARAKALAASLQELADHGAKSVQALPAAKRKFVAYHDSLSYLRDWLGLDQVATVEPKPGIPPSPSHVASVLTLMRSGGDAPRVVLQEAFYPRKTSDTLARLAGAQVVLLPGGTRFAEGETYLTRSRRAQEMIRAALSR